MIASVCEGEAVGSASSRDSATLRRRGHIARGHQISFRRQHSFGQSIPLPPTVRFLVTSQLRLRDRLRDRLRGTFLPFFLASDSPMAMACLRLFTRPPLPPFRLRSVPCFRLCIALDTSRCELRLYFRRLVRRAMSIPPGLVRVTSRRRICKRRAARKGSGVAADNQ